MKTVQSPSGKLLAKHIAADDIKDGLGFFSDDEDFIQVGTWRYEAGKDLLAHQHNLVERTVERTQEVLVIQKGSIQASIFDEDEAYFVRVLRCQAGRNFGLAQWRTWL